MTAPRLDDEAIDRALAALPDFRRDGDRLVARWRFGDFARAFAFMTAVARIAEERDHHPDWRNSYSTVEVWLSTHDAGGITGKDLELAAAMSDLADRHGGAARAADPTPSATPSTASPASDPPRSYPRDIPPLWFLVALVAMVLLHLFAPGARVFLWPWTLLGGILVLAGLALVLTAAGLFHRLGTGVRPFTEATRLVASGPYRFTRNPMYLGLVTVLVGSAIALGTATPWLLPPAFAILVDRRFVRREEVFLRERFGAVYDLFCRTVRRWL